MTTRWSRVLRTGAGTQSENRLALEDICQTYWFPLFAYLRRRGVTREEAEDSVQAFFARLVERNLLGLADPNRGRFRGFLLASFRQFLLAKHSYDSTARRRPSGLLLSIDIVDADERYIREVADSETPESLYERACALSLIGRTLEQLRHEVEESIGFERFRAFQGTLTGQSSRSAREVGDTLGMTEGAVRVAIYRLRRRFAEILRAEVAATLGPGDNVDDEIQSLLTALRHPGRV